MAKNVDIMAEPILFNRVLDAVLDRLELLSKSSVFGCTAEELVDGGFVDPVRLFVKQEPHGVKKVNEGRYRLISSVSLVDQLVERLLFTLQNKTEIDMWRQIPSKPGIGLTDEDLFDMQDQISGKSVRDGGSLAEADISGWDWSVQSWELDSEAYMRVRLAGLPGPFPREDGQWTHSDEPFANIVYARYYCLGLSVYGLSDGKLFAQRQRGIQLSGSYTTSSSNSRMRVLAAMLVGAKWAVAMGDDCLEQYVPDAPVRYAELGHVVKDYQKAKADEFSFCSHRFERREWNVSVFEPLNWGKTFYRLLCQKPISAVESAMLLKQFSSDMRHSPYLEDMLIVLVRVGWGTRNFAKDVTGGFSEPEEGSIRCPDGYGSLSHA